MRTCTKINLRILPSFLVLSLVFSPVAQASMGGAATNRSVYRSNSIDPVDVDSLCNPNDNPREGFISEAPPRGIHALCLEKAYNPDTGIEDLVKRLFYYDRNGSMVDATGTEPLCNRYLSNRKLREMSAAVADADGNCTGPTSKKFFYTAGGEKIAVFTPATSDIDVYAEKFARFSNGQIRFNFNGEVEESESGASLAFVKDHLGSTITTADSVQVLERIDRRPYGATWHHTQEGNRYTDRDFTGQLRVGHLLDYKARQYAPEMGRFVQADPIKPDPNRSLGLNPYTYAYNNPQSFTDDTGHNPLLIIAVAVAIYSGVKNVNANSGEINGLGDFAGVFAAGAVRGAASVTAAASGNPLLAMAIASGAEVQAQALEYSAGIRRPMKAFGAMVLASGTQSLVSSSVGSLYGQAGLVGAPMVAGAQAAASQVTVAASIGAFGYDYEMNGGVVLGSIVGAAVGSGITGAGSLLPNSAIAQTAVQSVGRAASGIARDVIEDGELDDVAGIGLNMAIPLGNFKGSESLTTDQKGPAVDIQESIQETHEAIEYYKSEGLNFKIGR